jgi:hypothetical protein
MQRQIREEMTVSTSHSGTIEYLHVIKKGRNSGRTGREK